MNMVIAMAAQAAMDSLAQLTDEDRRDTDRLCAVALGLVLCHFDGQLEDTE